MKTALLSRCTSLAVAPSLARLTSMAHWTTPYPTLRCASSVSPRQTQPKKPSSASFFATDSGLTAAAGEGSGSACAIAGMPNSAERARNRIRMNACRSRAVVQLARDHQLELARAHRYPVADLELAAVAALDRTSLAVVHANGDFEGAFGEAGVHLGRAGGSDARALVRSRAERKRKDIADHPPLFTRRMLDGWVGVAGPAGRPTLISWIERISPHTLHSAPSPDGTSNFIPGKRSTGI